MDDILDDDLDVDEPNTEIRKLRELAKKGRKYDALETETNTLRQRVALMDAGLNLDAVKAKALLAAHDGDTTPEALQKTAQTLGFWTPPAAEDPAEETQRQEAAQAQERISAASAGATPIEAPKIQERIAAHEAAGEWQQAKELKAEMVAAQFAAQT